MAAPDPANSTSNSKAPVAVGASRYVAWALLVAAALFSGAVRGRLLAFPLERDEGEFAYAGQLILEGIPPYELACNMKLPGTYLAYAAIMAVFGQSTVGIHLGLLVVNLSSIVLVFFLARDVWATSRWRDLVAGMAAAGFSLLAVSPAMLGMAAHATHLVAMFAVAGVWTLWRAMGSRRVWLFFLGGFLMGTAFLMKQQGVFMLVFGGLVALAPVIRPSAGRGQALAGLTAYVVGGLLPYGLICLWLWQAGVFATFWFWTVLYAREYASQVPLRLAFEVFWTSFQGVVRPNWTLWLLALVGCLWLVFRRVETRERVWFVLGFLLFSFLCVCPGFYFRDHYFLAMLPALALLIGVGAEALIDMATRLPRLLAPKSALEEKPVARRGAKPRTKETRPDEDQLPASIWLAVVVVALALLLPIGLQMEFFFHLSPNAASRRAYGPNPFVEAPLLAEYLRQHSDPAGTIAVLGSEPEIYFYANRHSATGHIYTYGLMEIHPYAETMQKQMIAQIEKANPEYIVLVDVETSWLKRPNSTGLIFQWMASYLAGHYLPVGIADILSETKTEWKWDDEAVNYRPRGPHLILLRRKS